MVNQQDLIVNMLNNLTDRISDINNKISAIKDDLSELKSNQTESQGRITTLEAHRTSDNEANKLLCDKVGVMQHIFLEKIHNITDQILVKVGKRLGEHKDEQARMDKYRDLPIQMEIILKKIEQKTKVDKIILSICTALGVVATLLYTKSPATILKLFQ